MTLPEGPRAKAGPELTKKQQFSWSHCQFPKFQGLPFDLKIGPVIAVILPLAGRGQTLAIDGGGELADTFFKAEITFPNKVILLHLMRAEAQNKTLDVSAANLLLKRQ